MTNLKIKNCASLSDIELLNELSNISCYETSKRIDEIIDNIVSYVEYENDLKEIYEIMDVEDDEKSTSIEKITNYKEKTDNLYETIEKIEHLNNEIIEGSDIDEIIKVANDIYKLITDYLK